MFKKFRPLESSSEYTFKDPDTGYVYKGKDIKDLYRQVILYRAQNQLEPLDELPIVIENYLCTLPCNAGKCSDRVLERSWSTWIKGGLALIRNMAFRRKAPLEVAEKRAAQCATCTYNYFPDKGPFVNFVDDIAIMQVGEVRTSKHNELGSCAVCSCPLRGKVFVGGDLPPFTDEQVEKMRAVKCWQLELSKQDGK